MNSSEEIRTTILTKKIKALLHKIYRTKKIPSVAEQQLDGKQII